MTAAVEFDRWAASRRLVRFGRPVLAPLAASLVCRVAAQTLGVVLLVVSVRALTAAADGTAPPVGATVGLLVAVSTAKGVLRYLEQLSGHYVAFKALAMLRVDFYDRLRPQAPAGVLARRSGDLVARGTKDVDRVEVFFAHTLVPAVAALVVPVLVLGWLAVAVDPLLAAVPVPALVVAGAVVPGWGRREGAAATARVRVARGRLAQLITESLQGMREVLAFGAQHRRRHEALALADEVDAGLRGLGGLTARRRAVNAALMALTPPAVLVVGAWGHPGATALPWGEVAVAVVVALAVFQPVLAVEDVAPDLEQAFASARRIWAVTDTPPATVSPARPVPVPVPAGPLEVRFEDVGFTYPRLADDGADDGADAGPAPAGPRPAVLRGVHLTLPAGTVTAVVGASGSGKSTLVNLLTRAWDPDTGRVLLGGVDVRDLDLRELRRAVAVVGQTTYLFNGTVAENLRLAAPDATDAQLHEACRRAALHDDVTAMPQGYDTPVGETGERLSGGQRQRVAIARALLLDAPVLVLDEATSQLDVHTEAQVQGALAEVCRGRTVLVVAHRPGAVRTADRVVRIDELGRGAA